MTEVTGRLVHQQVVQEMWGVSFTLGPLALLGVAVVVALVALLAVRRARRR